MSSTKKTTQTSIASFFGKKTTPVIKSSPIKVENKEPVEYPSSDSEDKSLLIAPKNRAKKRVLSFDESDQDQKPNSSNENLKQTPTKNVKQMKIDEPKIEIKEENIIVSIEQKSITDPTSYNPGKTTYDPINDACWKLGDNVPYNALSATLLLIEETSARLEIIRILSNFFRSVRSLSGDDLVHCVYLCVNKLAPEYDGIELGIGETIIMKAIADSTGRTVEQLKLDYKAKGDLGLVAEASRSNQRTMFKPKPLTVSVVYKKLKEIAQLTGNKSQQRKSDIIKSLLVSCQTHETRYLVRSLIGKLRIGLAEQSMLVALAHACVRTEYPNLKEPTLKERLDAGALAVKDAFCHV